MEERSSSVTCHHYQYREETEAAANNEHLPPSPMRGDREPGHREARRQHQPSAGSSTGQLTVCEAWCRHGTGRLGVPFQQVLQARKTGTFLTPALVLPWKRNGPRELTPWTIFSCRRYCFRVSFRPNQCIEGALVMITLFFFFFALEK